MKYLLFLLIVSCSNPELPRFKKYEVKTFGRSLTCSELVYDGYGRYNLHNCVCFHTGKKFDRVISVVEVLEYSE